MSDKNNIKLCIDCRYHDDSFCDYLAKTKNKSLIDGNETNYNRAHCATLRYYEGFNKCGFEAKFFAPKEKTVEFCDGCKFLFPDEEIQNEISRKTGGTFKKDHFCWLHNKTLCHELYHPRIRKLDCCSERF